ncbi:MAG: iron ABC transporter permease, partial [Pseudomonadota bacterium]
GYSPSMDAAARSLGARPGDVVRRIHIPLLTPSLAAGAGLVFIDVMRELPATLILRPFNFETLATRVYRLASDERLAEASTSALIIVALGMLPVAFLNRIGR